MYLPLFRLQWFVTITICFCFLVAYQTVEPIESRQLTGLVNIILLDCWADIVSLLVDNDPHSSMVGCTLSSISRSLSG